MNSYTATGLFTLLFLLYWWLVSKLFAPILEAPKLKEAHWLLIGGANAAILFALWTLCPNVQVSYYTMMLLMLGEILLFYRDRFGGAVLCTLACCIHVVAIFMITLGAMSLGSGESPSALLANGTAILWCAVGTFLLLDLVIVGVLKFVPLSAVKLINQHKEQQWFMIAWMAVSSFFLLYMEHFFHNPTYPAKLVCTQLAASIALLIGLYIVLFFSIKTSDLLGYKEKNAELQQAISQEQQYRAFMIRDALASYKVNVTQDSLIGGFEEHLQDMGNAVASYSDMVVLMSQKMIYSEDIAHFVRNCARSNVLRLFEKGERELLVEYRRLMADGSYIWARAVINLAQDPDSGDVKGFICIKNIDDEKRKQLELQRRAERDPLTSLYNRSAASKLIDEYLAFQNRENDSALFMIDVDNFKEINDYLGHVYGDAVLCELAEKLSAIFQNNAIVGRIGGDEYIVFLKDGATTEHVQDKALEISKAFAVSYQGVGDKKHSISASVGIALFPRAGNTFKELYVHADIALYAAKSKGRNTYKIYDGCNFSAYASQRTEIQPIGNISQKGFRENRIEYVFKMLYQSDNPVAAIHSVLELVARHFSFERGYIFETSKDGKTSSNTFEWCADGVSPEIENLQNIPIEAVATAHSNFQHGGTFVLKSLDDLPEIERAILEPQGIKSMFQFGIFDKSHLLGFIGFDNCRSEIIPSDTEIDEMKTICNILATFFVRQYIDEVSERDLLARQEVMNHLENYIYVINVETFAILFMNDKIQTLLQNAESDTACYRFFRGHETQCPDCPLRELIRTKTDRIVTELYNTKLDIWMETAVSLMRWTDGSLACLVNCSNITKQKEAHLNHVHELEKLIYVDALIGCPSYHKFQVDAQRILEEERDKTHLLVKLDIDNFKLINQIYGYEKGNDILCYVAQALEHTMRTPNEVFARMANDEFIVLLAIDETSDIQDMNDVFLEHFNGLVGHEFSFKFRFPHGRYLIEPHGSQELDLKELFEKVNTAHKNAKLDKTVDFAFYDESMTKDALRVKMIENKMADALQHHEFSIYLQPKYYLKNEGIGGAEALTRWTSDNPELFSPSSFIPVFEQNGFITKLDFYVFKKVCQTIRSWVDAGIEPVTVSVNFSRLHLNNVNFVKKLCKIVDAVGIDRKYLEIEITETVIFDNIDTLERLLRDIHKSGFSMSMDDFGSGYSSLGMLKDFPVDVIKMDRSFFANQRDAARSKIVVGSIIQMASNLGIRIVAEGVEDQEHIDFLRELNCDMVQGYYYAKPMPIKDFTELLRKEKETGR